MNRGAAKVAIREAMYLNEWMRTGAEGDSGDDCYVETFAYVGSDPAMRGFTIKVEWGDTWMEVVLPRSNGIPLARHFSRLDTYLENELGWRLDAVGSGGDRLYATDTGVELLIVFSQSDVTFNTALPRVRKS